MSIKDVKQNRDLLSFDLVTYAQPYVVRYEYSALRYMNVPEELVLSVMCDPALRNSGYGNYQWHDLAASLYIRDDFVINALNSLIEEGSLIRKSGGSAEISELGSLMVSDFAPTEHALYFYRQKRVAKKPVQKEEQLYYCPLKNSFINAEEASSIDACSSDVPGASADQRLQLQWLPAGLDNAAAAKAGIRIYPGSVKGIPASLQATVNVLDTMARSWFTSASWYSKELALNEDKLHIVQADRDPVLVAASIRVQLDRNNAISLYSGQRMAREFISKSDESMLLDSVVNQLFLLNERLFDRACAARGGSAANATAGAEQAVRYVMPEWVRAEPSFTAAHLFAFSDTGSCEVRANPGMTCWRYASLKDSAVIICSDTMLARVMGQSDAGASQQDMVSVFLYELMKIRELKRLTTTFIVLTTVGVASANAAAAVHAISAACNAWPKAGFILRSAGDISEQLAQSAGSSDKSNMKGISASCWSDFISTTDAYLALVDLQSDDCHILMPELMECTFAGQSLGIEVADLWQMPYPDVLGLPAFADCSIEELSVLERLSGHISIHNHIGSLTVQRIADLADRGFIRADTLPDRFFDKLYSVSTVEQVKQLNSMVYSSYGRRKLSLKSFAPELSCELLKAACYPLMGSSARSGGVGRGSAGGAARGAATGGSAAIRDGADSEFMLLNFDIKEFDLLVKLTSFVSSFTMNRPSELISHKELWPVLAQPDELYLKTMEMCGEQAKDVLDVIFEPVRSLNTALFKVFEPYDPRHSWAVLDTNYVIKFSDTIARLSTKHNIVIPVTVIDELDNISHSPKESEELKKKVARGVREIEKLKDRAKHVKCPEFMLEMVRSIRSETNKDDLIIGTALQYMFNDVLFLSDDKMANSKASQLGLKTRNDL